ncbi:hypothetical protein COU78_05760 [Candidatus Peregrinibacteria bacterium CG10_big_fil_rev_8_21_14_0_10_49_24]|nr:MAG: hypothetical protein COV83_03545 [Candidatus Peregrinibacteria bacterium CG11_big_fil_rev_8_21_14_0_20_49_14]PIR50632.1 MAG: hypothetical protein COU78_05760 [Candidatus Peregrinibacteria bacterium CG10_big_fil_rev_8_21_14_0_10_49_24]PJA67050.1 MAG: hypothetical protein CO157_06345 [Candidatus Peregrinibacteria bacterium CG_4_9_14_3_um_filter_49_12]
MASQKRLTVVQQFDQKKSGRWTDKVAAFMQGSGYRIGENIEVRFLRVDPKGTVVQLSTSKHMELQGGQPAEPDPEPPSEAQGTWLRERLLTKQECTMRIGDYLFLQVDAETQSITFRLRLMAAYTVESLSDSCDAA